MKTLIGSVSLPNRLTGQAEPAEVFQGLDQKNLDDFARDWKPLLEQRQRDFPTWVESAAGNAQDSHWDWVGKAEAATRSLRYETFAVECGGQTQGMMLIDVMKFAQMPEQRGLELAYVEFVSSAPWNRINFVNQPKYRGVGLVLLGAAVGHSMDLGFKGRVGLHSLVEAEQWYVNIGFTDLGHDAIKNMRYFEMNERQATDFLR